MANYLFSLTPTFTQGLIIGQLSILVLLTLILKYLFLDSRAEGREEYAQSYEPSPLSGLGKERVAMRQNGRLHDLVDGFESAAWFNLIVQQIVETYRLRLRGDTSGPEGDEIARARVERFINEHRPEGFVDPIRILSVNLGSSAPRITSARTRKGSKADVDEYEVDLDMTYTDSVSVSLSTSVLFNYPVPYFARLPVSLTVSLSLFSAALLLRPPNPQSAIPTLSMSIQPSFNLDLTTTSLIGSRAKLANVPKLHELIQSKVRQVIAERGTWSLVMPTLATAKAVKEDLDSELDAEVSGDL